MGHSEWNETRRQKQNPRPREENGEQSRAATVPKDTMKNAVKERRESCERCMIAYFVMETLAWTLFMKTLTI